MPVFLLHFVIYCCKLLCDNSRIFLFLFWNVRVFFDYFSVGFVILVLRFVAAAVLFCRFDINIIIVVNELNILL